MPKQDRAQHSRQNDPIEDEKPLKKARYVWEVKGKYHLKESSRNNNTLVEMDSTDTQTNSASKIENVPQNESKCDKQGQACSSKCCVQSFLAKADAILSDMEDEEYSNNNIDEELLNDIPSSLVSPRPKNEEYLLQKWQARQIARGFVDNTINSVLETWSSPPFNASDFVENCENDGQVEDDAILMAIQSHGLQSSSQRNVNFSNSHGTAITSKSVDMEESTQDNFENSQTELIKEHESISTPHNTNMMIWEISDPSRVHQRDTASEDPMDFLNAAVSAAIQKKGLSYSY